MSRKFKPRVDVLPPAQQHLWPELRRVPDLVFTLYGGTAIALRLGHRDSVAFDFFPEKPLDREAIETAFLFVVQSTTLQDQDTLGLCLSPVGTPRGNSSRCPSSARLLSGE